MRSPSCSVFGIIITIAHVLKMVNNRFEVWLMPQEWAGEDRLPVAFKSVSKERIVFRNAECLIAHPFEPEERAEKAMAIFSKALAGERTPNPEKPWSYIKVLRRDEEGEVRIASSMERLDRPRREQEQLPLL
jgi:hypothetical protein